MLDNINNRSKDKSPPNAVLGNTSITSSIRTNTNLSSLEKCFAILVIVAFISNAIIILLYTGNNTNNGDANVVVSTSDNRWWYEQLSSTSSSSRRSTRQRKASDPSIVVNSVGLDNKTNTCVPATLILFGVPKEFRCIWKAYMKNIVQINPRINFEAHIHMYSDLHGENFINEKNDEKNVTTESPEEIRGIIIDNGSIIEGSDTSFKSISTRMVTSSQNEYAQKNLS